MAQYDVIAMAKAVTNGFAFNINRKGDINPGIHGCTNIYKCASILMPDLNSEQKFSWFKRHHKVAWRERSASYRDFVMETLRTNARLIVDKATKPKPKIYLRSREEAEEEAEVEDMTPPTKRLRAILKKRDEVEREEPKTNVRSRDVESSTEKEKKPKTSRSRDDEESSIEEEKPVKKKKKTGKLHAWSDSE